MGGNWYGRSTKGIFEIPKPLGVLGIGVDAMPNRVRFSKTLTGNDLGKLGTVERLPSEEEINTFVNNSIEIKSILSAADEKKVHQKAQEFLNNNEVLSAWKVLLAK